MPYYLHTPKPRKALLVALKCLEVVFCCLWGAVVGLVAYLYL